MVWRISHGNGNDWIFRVCGRKYLGGFFFSFSLILLFSGCFSIIMLGYAKEKGNIEP